MEELLLRLGAAGTASNLNTSLPSSGGGASLDSKSSGKFLELCLLYYYYIVDILLLYCMYNATLLQVYYYYITGISTVVSLLSTLCRGSPNITYNLLRSNLLDSIESALMGSERCVLDTMRFIDLLLVLMFEGREALPKSSSSGGITSRNGSSSKLDNGGERSHRQLIDCIRSKDTEALVEAIDSGSE